VLEPPNILTLNPGGQMSRSKPLSLLLVALAFPSSAWAVRVSLAGGVSADFGGATLATITYTDGSVSNLKAGNGLSLNLGALAELLEFGEFGLQAQATGAIKYSTIQDASNAGVDWYRFPIELLAFAEYKPITTRLGFGFTYQVGSNISGSGVLEALQVAFQNAPGFIIEAGYIFNGTVALSLRYTLLRLSPVGSTQSFHANSIGVSLELFWPKLGG
jgi:hypothetical protein